MKRLWAVTACIWGLSVPVWAATLVRYTLAPVLNAGHLTALDVSLHFDADADGTTRVNLPDHWGGGEKFYTYLTDIAVDGAKSVSAPAPQTRILVSTPGASITVHYRINATLKAGEEASSDTDYSYPLIGPDRFLRPGPADFCHDRGPEEIARRLHLGRCGWLDLCLRSRKPSGRRNEY